MPTIYIYDLTCPSCSGSGQRLSTESWIPDEITAQLLTVTCPNCGGTGKSPDPSRRIALHQRMLLKANCAKNRRMGWKGSLECNDQGRKVATIQDKNESKNRRNLP